MNQLDSAMAACNRAIARFPENPIGYKALGELNEMDGDYTAARFQYERGLSLAPSDPDLLAGMDRCDRALDFQTEEGAGAGYASENYLLEVASRLSAVSKQDDKPETSTERLPEIIQPAGNRGSGPLIVEGPSAEENEDEPVTLIGVETGSSDVNIEDAPTTLLPASDLLAADTTGLVDIKDMRLLVTEERVTLVMETSGPVEFSTRSASDPSRLILRLQRARIAPGASVSKSIGVDVSLLSHVTIVESEPDSNVIVLVLYLGADTRHTVAGEAARLRVILERKTDQDS